MSASIFWSPVAAGQDLGVGGSSDWCALCETFGDAPVLGTEAIPILRGMAAVYGKGESAFAKLADLVERHGSIKVWAEW